MAATRANGTQILDGSLTESDLTLADVTTLNVNTSAHGFAPKLTNTGKKFLKDDGTWSPVISTDNTYTPSVAGTATLDLSVGNIHSITMPAGNITIAISNATVGQVFMVNITQDGTGSRTVSWFTTIKWVANTAPTLTTAASKRDSFGFRVTGAGTYDGFVIGQNI